MPCPYEIAFTEGVIRPVCRALIIGANGGCPCGDSPLQAGGTIYNTTMKYNPDIHHRCSIRLPGYDYSCVGAYFVTICTNGRECIFGEIHDGRMVLNEFGKIAQNCWTELHEHFPHILLDAFVVMPNHIHGIIIIVRARHAVPFRQFGKPTSGSLPTMVRSLKSAVTKQINEQRSTIGASVWQRNYYEHIIQNEIELNKIREYITNNPINWEEDVENPAM